jgi:hypothetical protein
LGGRLVLPGESYERPFIVCLGEDEVEYFWGGQIALPVVIGCVTYQVIPDNSTRQTGFSYLIAEKGGLMGDGAPLKLTAKISKERMITSVTSGGLAD